MLAADWMTDSMGGVTKGTEAFRAGGVFENESKSDSEIICSSRVMEFKQSFGDI